jgi:hypothetical protein
MVVKGVVIEFWNEAMDVKEYKDVSLSDFYF